MSAQGDGSIPILYALDQNAVRLLELPGELLDLVTYNGPQTLFFKSAPLPIDPAAVSSSLPTSPHAALCTRNQTFQIRQVQTSNSIFLLQPIATLSQDGLFTTPGLCALATCTSTLELSSTKPNPELLRSLIQVYDIDHSLDGHIQNGRTKASLFSDVPYSDGECQLLWQFLMAFELDGIAYQPSVKTTLKLWDAIVLNSTALGINLDDSFDVNDIWHGLPQDAGFPEPLFDAVITFLSADALSGSFHGLDKDRCILWLGISLANSGLTAQDGSQVPFFLEKWKAALPYQWADEVSVEKYKLLCAGVTASFYHGQGIESMLTQTKNLDTKKATAKRDWHEKFKATRT